jgi:hypothetical protein
VQVASSLYHLILSSTILTRTVCKLIPALTALWNLCQIWYWQYQYWGWCDSYRKWYWQCQYWAWCCETYVWDGTDFFRGVRLSPLGTAATVWLTVPAQDDRWGGWWWLWRNQWNANRQGKQKYSEEIYPLPLCPPQILHGLTRAQTRAAAMGSPRLTARVMAQPGGTDSASTDGGAVRLKSGGLLTSCWSNMVFIFEVVIRPGHHNYWFVNMQRFPLKVKWCRVSYILFLLHFTEINVTPLGSQSRCEE